MQSSNEKLLQEARVERDKLMRDAKATADSIIAEATEKANSEKNRIVAEAQDAIRTEKNLALAEVKKQVADLSLAIAEKVIRRQLSDKATQMELVKGYLNDVKVN